MFPVCAGFGFCRHKFPPCARFFLIGARFFLLVHDSRVTFFCATRTKLCAEMYFRMLAEVI